MTRSLAAFAVCLFFSSALMAQVVTTDIPYITVQDSITLTFNSNLGNGALSGTGQVYIHTGLVKESSDYEGAWGNQRGIWGQADPELLMNNQGGGIQTLGINIESFYNTGTWDGVLALAMVFRDEAGNTVGTNANGSDILIPVFETTTDLDAVVLDPVVDGKTVEPNDPLVFDVRSNNPNSLINLYQDGTLIGQALGDAASASVNTSTPGKYYLSYTVEVGGQTVADTTYFIVRDNAVTQDPPQGVVPGINFINSTTVTFCLLAPNKQFAYFIGDATNWEVDPAYQMKRATDGERYWITLNNVTPQTEYRFQYFVDGMFKVADPYSYKILEEQSDAAINPNIYPNLIDYPDQTHGNVSVYETDMPQYQWQAQNFQRPAKEDLVIYELLIRDFAFRKSFGAVIDSLDYLHKLGINAIQLMPVIEFEGNDSWGYNPIFFTAVDKKYGPASELKRLIDEAHQRGIAVILDIVPNHAFGRSPYVKLYWDPGLQRPAANSPFFNPVATHPYSVGYDFNHESTYTRTMFHRIFKYWIEEFHIDGYRLDLSKGLTQTWSGNDVGAWSQYDQSRINILFDYANTIWSYDADFHFILEHLADNSEETVLANGNMMLWSKASEQYNQATMGWSTNADWGWQMSYQAKGWNMPRAVGYMESHDEERIMFKNVSYGNDTNAPYNCADTTTALYRMQAAAAMFSLVPGPKMIWQFGELGYDISIFWPSGLDLSRVAAKPIRWNYYWEEPRQKLYKVWSAINALKHMQPVYSCTTYGLDLSGTGKRMWLSHPDMNVSVTANFDVNGFDMTPDFQHTGTWYNYLTGEPLEVNQTNMTLHYEPGQYYIYTDQQLDVPDTSFTPQPGPDGIADLADNPLGMMVFPNPSADMFYIDYLLGDQQFVSLQVHDLTGRLVTTLGKGMRYADRMRTVWNGTDQSTRSVANGQYILTLTTSGNRISKMVVLQR
ncbi:MAG: T9SS type A sorting domain-containing protein [Flavobacteriales bacterium]|nr:T9SS type A sorting domain-containing protein [Flavobacteriales bacterium]